MLAHRAATYMANHLCHTWLVDSDWFRAWPPPRVQCGNSDLLHAGEEPSTGIVAGITPGQTTLVTCVEDTRLEFQVSPEELAFTCMIGS